MTDKTDNEIKLVYHNSGEKRVIAWPCYIDVPQDGGTVQRQKLTARFEQLPRERVLEIFSPVNQALGDPNAKLVDEALVGFVDLPVQGGGTVSDADAKAFFMTQQFVVKGLAAGYLQMANGLVPKN